MPARKIKKVVTKELEQDIASFTIPSPQVPTVPDNDNLNNPLLPDSSGESIFWHAKKGIIWVSFFGILIVFAIVAGVFIYREGIVKSSVNNQNSAVSSPTPVEKPKVSPTPTPEKIDVGKYTIEVLNGSGIKGEAAKVKKLLEEEKFTVSSVGNADTLDYQKTIIQAKKTVPKEYLEKLKSFLEKSYILDDAKELPDNEKSDVVIIVGSK